MFKKIFQTIEAFLRRYDDTHNFTCDLCGREVFENEHICGVCRKTLPWNDGNVCPLCGRKVGEAGICLECKQKRLSVQKARSPLLFEGDAARLVLQAKRKKYFYRALAELMYPSLCDFPDAEALVFVPMTDKAYKKRGYNQSRLIAEELSRLGGPPVLDAAVKQRETDSQKTLGRSEREKNLERAFHITDRSAVKGKNLLIIDDTLTTGATVSELANALYRAGAARVDALTATSVEYKDPYGKPPRKKGAE